MDKGLSDNLKELPLISKKHVYDNLKRVDIVVYSFSKEIEKHFLVASVDTKMPEIKRKPCQYRIHNC